MSEVDIAKYQEFVEQTLQPRLQGLMDAREKSLVERQEYLAAAKKLDDLMVREDDSPLSQEDKVHTLIDIGCGVHVRAISRTTLKSLKVHIKGESGEFTEMRASKAKEAAIARAKKLAKDLDRAETDISSVVTDIEECLAAIAQLKTLQSKSNK
jgi:rubrerythrin